MGSFLYSNVILTALKNLRIKMFKIIKNILEHVTPKIIYSIYPSNEFPINLTIYFTFIYRQLVLAKL